MKLFSTPKIPSCILPPSEIEDLCLMWSGYKSNNYYYIKGNLITVEYTKINKIDMSTGIFKTVTDKELLNMYVTDSTDQLYLEDVPLIQLCEGVTYYINNGLCYINIFNETYTITYDQFKLLKQIDNFEYTLTPSDNETVHNICPYCRQRVDSDIHKKVCCILRKGKDEC